MRYRISFAGVALFCACSGEPVDRLIRAVSAEGPHRSAALVTLKKIHTPKVNDALANLLNDPNRLSHYRDEYAAILASRRDARAFGYLTRRLEEGGFDESSPDETQAIESFLSFDDPRMADTLVMVYVRRTRGAMKQREAIAAKLGSLGAVDHLAKIFHSSELDLEVLEALVETGDKRAGSFLCSRLTTEPPPDRSHVWPLLYAIQRLDSLECPEAFESIRIELKQDPLGWSKQLIQWERTEWGNAEQLFPLYVEALLETLASGMSSTDYEIAVGFVLEQPDALALNAVSQVVERTSPPASLRHVLQHVRNGRMSLGQLSNGAQAVLKSATATAIHTVVTGDSSRPDRWDLEVQFCNLGHGPLVVHRGTLGVTRRGRALTDFKPADRASDVNLTVAELDCGSYRTWVEGTGIRLGTLRLAFDTTLDGKSQHVDARYHLQ